MDGVLNRMDYPSLIEAGLPSAVLTITTTALRR